MSVGRAEGRSALSSGLHRESHVAMNERNNGRYDDVWRASEPYLRARKSDVHIPLSFAFARKLLEVHPEADQDIVLLAVLLHDIGWWSIDMRDIIEKGFGPNMMQSDRPLPARKRGCAAVPRSVAENRLARIGDRGGGRNHRWPRYPAAGAFTQRPPGARCRQALAFHRHRRRRRLRLAQNDAGTPIPTGWKNRPSACWRPRPDGRWRRVSSPAPARN